MLELKGINKSFRGKPVLKDVTLALKKGQYLCLKGPSGSGKTTLLNICAGMLEPDSGEVLVDGSPVEKSHNYRKNIVGYLPCGNCLLESLTVLENITYASDCSNEKAKELLAQFGVLSVVNAYPREISSGEYKRVCFARALAMDTDYLLLDEPTSNLDEESASIIIDAIAKSDKGIMVSTHDHRLMRGTIFTL